MLPPIPQLIGSVRPSACARLSRGPTATWASLLDTVISGPVRLRSPSGRSVFHVSAFDFFVTVGDVPSRRGMTVPTQRAEPSSNSITRVHQFRLERTLVQVVDGGVGTGRDTFATYSASLLRHALQRVLTCRSKTAAVELILLHCGQRWLLTAANSVRLARNFHPLT